MLKPRETGSEISHDIDFSAIFLRRTHFSALLSSRCLTRAISERRSAPFVIRVNLTSRDQLDLRRYIFNDRRTFPF